MTLVTNFVVILVLMAGAWWLSGFDSRVTGEDPVADVTRRALRCGVTLAFLILATLNGYIAIFIFVSLGVLWASCVAELFARQFHKVVDPEDDRKFDPKETERNLDLLAKLTREGRIKEALEFSEKLQKSSEISPMALEAKLHHLYQEILNSIDTSPLLRDVRDLVGRGEFAQAELRLKQILVTQPTNWAAMLLLMRAYTKGFLQPNRALAFLQDDKAQPRLYPAFVPYARSSIAQWTAQAHQPPEEQQNILSHQIQPSAIEPELSVDELLKSNQLATAVERLEKELSEQPRNFELWIKLAEIYAVYCADANRAVKIIQRMQNTSAFTAEEIQLAKGKLREWQAARR